MVSKKILYSNANIYVNNIIRYEKLNNKVIQLINKYKKQQYEIILLTKTLDLISSVIIDKLNLNQEYSSKLNIEIVNVLAYY